MSNEHPESVICTCGKVGWTDEKDADRNMRVTIGKDRRRGLPTGRMNVYLCISSKSGLWHIGHLR